MGQMAYLSPRGLRGRLVALVLLAILPAIALILVTGADQRRRAVRDGRQVATKLVGQITADLGRFLEGGRHVLTVLASVSAVQDGDAPGCSRLARELMATDRRYANIGAARADGAVFCSGVPQSGAVNVSDRTYFRKAIAEDGFAVGDFLIGRITAKPSLAFGYPVRSATNRGARVVFATLDLDRLADAPVLARFPRGTVVTVVDRQGTVLLRQPGNERWRGKTIAGEPLVQSILSEKNGETQTTGLDGVRRVYAFQQLPGGSGSAFVSIGLPASEVFGSVNRALIVNVTGLTLIGLLALAAATWLGDRFVVSPVRRAIEAEKRAAAREHEAAEALRTADEIKNIFLAAVGHDLRNPVAAIRGFAFLLRERPDTPEEDRKQMLEMMEKSAIRLGRLLDSLLDMQRLTAGTMETKRTAVNVLELVQRVVGEQDLRDHIVTVDGHDGAVPLDEAEVERIVENLVRNAVKYTPLGTAVEVRIERSEDGVLLTVDDRGPGVPDDLKPVIFEAFKRGVTRGASGMGVGLFLVARFAELHGGRAWVEDRPGGGARFMVSLPAS